MIEETGWTILTPSSQAKRQRQTFRQARILEDTDSEVIQRVISQPESYDADTIVVDTSEIWENDDENNDFYPGDLEDNGIYDDSIVDERVENEGVAVGEDEFEVCHDMRSAYLRRGCSHLRPREHVNCESELPICVHGIVLTV